VLPDLIVAAGTVVRCGFDDPQRRRDLVRPALPHLKMDASSSSSRAVISKSSSTARHVHSHTRPSLLRLEHANLSDLASGSFPTGATGDYEARPRGDWRRGQRRWGSRLWHGVALLAVAVSSRSFLWASPLHRKESVAVMLESPC
jgi:hypothetical protein